MRLPLFNVFEFPQHKSLYEAIHAAGPGVAWSIMKELEAFDQPLYRAHQTGDDNFDSLRTRALGFMNAVPGLAAHDKSTHATRFAEYGPKLQFESTFLNLWMRDKETLFRDVVEVVGRHHQIGRAHV